MNSDYFRGATVASRGDLTIVAAGVTFVTDYIDTAAIVGPVTFIATAASNAQLSYTFTIEAATARGATPSANGTGNATVTDDDDFPGGRAAQGVNSSGQITSAVNNELSAAISYNGDSRYVRGRLVVANASNATQNVAVSIVGIGMPQITPAR